MAKMQFAETGQKIHTSSTQVEQLDVLTTACCTCSSSSSLCLVMDCKLTLMVHTTTHCIRVCRCSACSVNERNLASDYLLYLLDIILLSANCFDITFAIIRQEFICPLYHASLLETLWFSKNYYFVTIIVMVTINTQ